VPVLASGTSLVLRVVGIAAARTAQAPTLFVTDARAASLLSQPGRIDALAVYPAGSTATGTLADRLSVALRAHGVTVLTGAQRGLAESPARPGRTPPGAAGSRLRRADDRGRRIHRGEHARAVGPVTAAADRVAARGRRYALDISPC
jgi:hypothetical protein